MTQIGQPERATQNRIVELFQEELNYHYYGNWENRENNKNVEEYYLRRYLSNRYPQSLINRAVHILNQEANNPGRSLYENNKAVYRLLRYGVQVKADVSSNNETVNFIDWKYPRKNDFAIAEEVTVLGNREKRPDIVIYINGIAIGVLELKRSTVSIGDGIRQSIVNQQPDFIEGFFSTIQFVFAGSDSEGLRYGTIGTSDKYFLTWKEDIDDQTRLSLDKYLLKLCDKDRLIELIHDFVLFDGGVKKLPRVHQYFAVKSAQKFVDDRESGIIWHTQGSGKSIVMVILAKWILENNHDARVVIITDRDELDKQIETVFNEAGEKMKRTSSGRDLMNQLAQPIPRLLCSLVHKFGRRDVDNFERFIQELETQPITTSGELFIFVDECHRSQSGKLHRAMKAMLPKAVFIGFTGTPLLKKDRKTSLEVFGRYIHTYKFNEAVQDEVILDLMYEARDIDQRISSPERIDAWFDSKTRGLNDYQKMELKKKWGTMQKVLSSKSRMEKVVNDILLDFSTKPRLNSDTGNAFLVASSIFEACKYFEMFQRTELKGKCAIVTSYNPSTRDIVTEGTGEATETEKEFIYRTYVELLGDKSTEAYEDTAKERFIKYPATMKLLIVVDKLLTGFDAPPCTYLYIDKSMQDHGLFQAICRVNRLHTDDKQFGYVVDYKDLFRKVENAVAVYTSELDYDTFDQKDCDILLKDRLEAAKERLDAALEELALLCEHVEPPKEKIQYLHYFCGNVEDPEELTKTEHRRVALYKGVVKLIRAYANIAEEIEDAGYTTAQIEDIKLKLVFYTKLREEIRLASGEILDLKPFEADMRFLIDNYLQADESRTISPFSDMSLLEIIVKTGIADALDKLPDGIKGSREAVAETIENNVRHKIIKDQLTDPAFFDEMSKLLAAIINERKANAVSYEEYLKKIADLAKRVFSGKADSTPETLKTPAQRALYNNLAKDEELALSIDEAVKRVKKAEFRGNQAKENEIKAEILKLVNDVSEVERIFKIIVEHREY